MKLAEALLQRSEYQKKLDSLRDRIIANLKVQEGDRPHEDPALLLQESLDLHEALGKLIMQINARNNTAQLPSGQTLADALVQREMLKKKRAMLADIAACATDRDYRLTRAEIKMQVTLPVDALQKQVDDLSRDFRALDTQIQALNWTVEL